MMIVIVWSISRWRFQFTSTMQISINLRRLLSLVSFFSLFFHFITKTQQQLIKIYMQFLCRKIHILWMLWWMCGHRIQRCVGVATRCRWTVKVQVQVWHVSAARYAVARQRCAVCFIVCCIDDTNGCVGHIEIYAVVRPRTNLVRPSWRRGQH